LTSIMFANTFMRTGLAIEAERVIYPSFE